MEVQVPKTYSYIGCSFTITKTALFYYYISYTNSLTVALGIKATNSTTAGSITYTENYGETDNVGFIGCLAILFGHITGRTYYIFAKAKNTNYIDYTNTVHVSRLGPGNTN